MEYKINREKGVRKNAPQINPPEGWVQIGEWTTSTRHTREGLIVPKGTTFQEVLEQIPQKTLEGFWGIHFISGNEIVCQFPGLIIGHGGKFIKNFPNKKVIKGMVNINPEGAGATIPRRGNNGREYYLHYPSEEVLREREEEKISRQPKSCSRCGTRISGGYRLINGKNVCGRCDK